MQHVVDEAVAAEGERIAPRVFDLAEGPVLLDAECAWWGDPAFDIAFCLNHLLLKCLWTPAASDAFLRCFDRDYHNAMGNPACRKPESG